MFGEHKDHAVTQFSEAVVKYKDTIETLLARCQDKIGMYDQQIEALAKFDDVVHGIEQQVRWLLLVLK